MLKSENISASANNEPSQATDSLKGYAYAEVENEPSVLAEAKDKQNTKSFTEELDEKIKTFRFKSQETDLMGEDQEISAQLYEDEWENLFGDLNAQSAMIASLHKYFEKQGKDNAEGINYREYKLSKATNDFLNTDRILPSDPIIDIDKEKLKISIEFPSLQDLKSITVQYDPSARSVTAEMITSQEAARVLQNQVSELERNLAKHDIKLQHLKINATSSGSSQEEKRKKQREQREKEQE